MNKLHPPLQAALLLACTLTALSAAAEYREQGAHVHGIARMDLVLEDHTLSIDLDTPAANLLGFEHAPRDAAEEAVLKQAVARLHEAKALFNLPQAAGCEVETVEVASALLGHEESHVHHEGHDADAHEGEAGHEHADMEASYRFHCASPAKLDGITVNLFQLFPATEKLEVQLITPRGQGAAKLTADSPRLTL